MLRPTGTIVGGCHHCKPPIRRKQYLNLHRSEFKLCRMQMCSSDNHYTATPVFKANVFDQNEYWINGEQMLNKRYLIFKLFAGRESG